MKFVLSGIFCAALFSLCFYYRKKQKRLQEQFDQLANSYNNLNRSYSALHDNWHSDIRDNYITLQDLRSELDKLRVSENELKILVSDAENRWKSFAEKEILKQKTELETWKGTELQKEIDKSVNKSRTILRGKTMEQFAAFSEEMKEYSPADFRFLGSPIDFVIFDGASKILDGQDTELSIVFSDIKTGEAKLTKLQRAIKKAVEEGKVKWTTVKLG